MAPSSLWREAGAAVIPSERIPRPASTTGSSQFEDMCHSYLSSEVADRACTSRRPTFQTAKGGSPEKPSHYLGPGRCDCKRCPIDGAKLLEAEGIHFGLFVGIIFAG